MTARLQRALSLWDLVIYGIVVISPVGAMSFFGILNQKGGGHAVTSILIATFAMLLTAISYGRMARAYPSAGSAFTYVGQEIHPLLGYIVGWSMAMDYMLGPLICVLWCSQQAHDFVPAIPYWTWALAFALSLTVLNLQGVKISARANTILVAGMVVVIAAFLVAALLYIFGHPHSSPGSFTRPFYDPLTWSWQGLWGGTSLAVLTYLGFDGISTLAEEARNPRRDILLATVLTCLIIGVFSMLEVYSAQLIWPISEPYPDIDTAFTFVAQRAWAPLFVVVGLTLIVATGGTGMAAQLGAARLLYAMGRSGALPEAFFGAIDPKRCTPRNNVLLIGALAFGGALVLPAIAGEATGYELGANLLNFGALIAFMGVNVAALMRHYWRAENPKLADLLVPALGFIVCLLLWWGLSARAKIFGAVWLASGILIWACKRAHRKSANWIRTGTAE